MILEIIELKKDYGKIHALDALNLKLSEGIYGLLGPNGAGKSTLMNILTLNLRQDGGSILWDGQDIFKMGEGYRTLIGYMPQEQICYPQFSAWEFMCYMAKLKGFSPRKQEIQKQLQELLETVHLWDVRKQRISTFSGGMKRRVILAQALIGDPRILILDEPTAGLDPKERISMRNLIARFSSGRIVLLATHIASDVECIADRIILMKNGRAILNENPFRLIEKVRPHVQEVLCTKEKMQELQNADIISNCVQTEEGFSLHVIGKEEYGGDRKLNITLDDVYLYYFEVCDAPVEA